MHLKYVGTNIEETGILHAAVEKEKKLMNCICTMTNELHFEVQGLRKLDSYKCHQIDLIFFPFKQSSVGLNPESLNQTYYGLDTFHLTTGMCLLGRRKIGNKAIKA